MGAFIRDTDDVVGIEFKKDRVIYAIGNGMGYKDALTYGGIFDEGEISALEADGDFQRRVDKAVAELENYLLEQMKKALDSQVRGGKANDSGVKWMLERLYERYRGGGSGSTDGVVNLIFANSDLEKVFANTEVGGE